MQLMLFVTDGCQSCKRVEKKIQRIVKDNPNLNFTVKNLNEEKPKNIFIVPALFVDNKLYAYGDIEFEKLMNKINSKLGD